MLYQINLLFHRIVLKVSAGMEKNHRLSIWKKSFSVFTYLFC